MSAALDFNRSNLSDQPINKLVNELIEHAEPPRENYRQYLGASAIGSECLRKVQYDWMCDPVFPARIKDIFERGHFFENVTRQYLLAAGFKFAPANGSNSTQPMACFAAMLTGSSLPGRDCRQCDIQPYGNTNVSRRRAGNSSSAMA